MIRIIVAASPPLMTIKEYWKEDGEQEDIIDIKKWVTYQEMGDISRNEFTRGRSHGCIHIIQVIACACTMYWTT